MTNTRRKVVGFDFKMTGNNLSRVVVAHDDAGTIAIVCNRNLMVMMMRAEAGSWMQVYTLRTWRALTRQRLGCHDARHASLIGGRGSAPAARRLTS